jgi:hypothetical protein
MTAFPGNTVVEPARQLSFTVRVRHEGVAETVLLIEKG